MRKCQVAIGDCFAEASKQCLNCGKWFCLNHFIAHDTTHENDSADTNIRLLGLEVVFDTDVAQGVVKIHPLTFCQTAAHCLRDKAWQNANIITSIDMENKSKAIANDLDLNWCTAVDTRGKRCVYVVGHTSDHRYDVCLR